MMVTSHSEIEIKKDEQNVLKGEPDLDHMTQQVPYLFTFTNFYDQMDFDIGQRLAITKAISELSDSKES